MLNILAKEHFQTAATAANSLARMAVERQALLLLKDREDLVSIGNVQEMRKELNKIPIDEQKQAILDVVRSAHSPLEPLAVLKLQTEDDKWRALKESDDPFIERAICQVNEEKR